MTITVFTCMRNEGPFLLEWLAWLRLIGVGEVIVFSNDCDDGTDALLDALAAQGALRHIPQERQAGRSLQWQALQQVAKQRLLAGADWALFCDVDEFPLIHAGAARLPDLIAALPADTAAVTLPWRLFGANGQVQFRDAPITAQFTRSAPPNLYHPVAGRFFKTLFRPEAFQRPGVHRPKRHPDAALPLWADGAGQPLPPAFAERDGQLVLPALQVSRDLVELHHYSLRSAESFLVKSERGLANSRVKQIDLSYWVERNFNTVENHAAARHAEALAEGMTALKSLPGIASLHEAACRWHSARAAALLGTHQGYRLFCDCLHAADSAALPPQLAMALYAKFAQLPKAED